MQVLIEDMSRTSTHSRQLVSVEEYLQGEKSSEVRHEYVEGSVYSMAGSSDDHNRIAINIAGELREQLRGTRCEPFMADMKFKMTVGQTYYYPDVLVACDPKDNSKYHRERPAVVFEVLSSDTQRTDQSEKRSAYALVPSLKAYVLVSQEKMALTVLRRGRVGPWRAEVVAGPDAILKLPEIKVLIPLSRIYERTAIAGR
jgi:Uma2 family endonuclease